VANDETGDGAPPPSPPPGRKPREQKAATPAGPTAQEIAASLASLQKPAEGQFRKLEIWTLLLTGVMAIATVVSVVVARDQWLQLRKQNEAISQSNDSSKRIARAYIAFSSIEISRYSSNTDRVTLTLKNVGQTPASIDRTRIGLSYYRAGELTEAVQGISLKQGNLSGYSVGAGEPLKRVVELEVDPKLRDAYTRGIEVERLVVIIIDYRDIYDNPQRYFACPFRNRDWDRMAFGPQVVNCEQVLYPNGQPIKK
jgi:hypothetical protein